jgi:membrane protease subunit HflC
MASERGRITQRYLSEGEGQAKTIRGKISQDSLRIISEAYKAAQGTMGCADSAATRIATQTYDVDPDFYNYTKSMEILKNLKGARLVLQQDNALGQYLHKGPNK